MEPFSHRFNTVGDLQVITGANLVGANFLIPDHQSAVYQISSAFQPNESAFMLPSSNRNITSTNTIQVERRNGWAAQSAWTKYQAVIKQQYLHEKKPLQEVMRFMESEHGFKATVKMYRDHIKQWGFDKKNKEPDMRAVVRKHKQRADQGKISTIRVRGQIRNFAEIAHYWERKGVSIDDIIARQTTSPTPEAVEIFTPVPSPILTPPVLAIPEHIFLCTRDYIKGSFESGTWYSKGQNFTCRSIKSGIGAHNEWSDLISECNLAYSLDRRKFPYEAGQAMSIITTKIKRIVSTDYPSTLAMLFRLIISMRRDQNKEETALKILRQFAANGKELLGSEHPLSRICAWSESIRAYIFEDCAIKCLELIADQFESSIGPMHRSTLFSRIDLIRSVNKEGRTRIDMLQKLLGVCEKTLRPDDVGVLTIRADLAYEYYSAGSYDDAIIMIQKNIANFQDLSSMNAGLYDYSEVLRSLASCQYAIGEVDLGIATLHQAIDLTILKWGPQHRRVKIWLLVLEDWYLEQGHWDLAAQLLKQRLDALKSLDMD